MDSPVDSAVVIGQRFAQVLHLFWVGDVEFKHGRFTVELAGGALGQAQPAASAGQDDLGSFLLGSLCNPKRNRGVGEDARHKNSFTVKNAHSGI